jgi:DNA replication protein DnaC
MLASKHRPSLRGARQQKLPHQDFLLMMLGDEVKRRESNAVAQRAQRAALDKSLRHAWLDNTYEAELRRLVSCDLLILDDFGLDAMDATASHDISAIMTERHRSGSIIITSNRGPDEWLATFADPVRAQAAIDRFTSNAYDLVIEGDSYRGWLKPKLERNHRAGQKEKD